MWDEIETKQSATANEAGPVWRMGTIDSRMPPIDYDALLAHRRQRLSRLSEAQWHRIVGQLPGNLRGRALRKPAHAQGINKVRLFVEGVLWVAQTHLPWKQLPAHYGKYHAVYVRFTRWCAQNAWGPVLSALADEPDLQLNLAELIGRTRLQAGPRPPG